MEKLTRQEAKKRGLPRCYGSACKKHPSLLGERYVSGSCVSCAKEYLVRNRLENLERTKATARRNNVTLKEKRKKDPVKRAAKLALDKKYRAIHKDTVRAGIALWSLRNPEKVKAYAKKIKEKNKSKILAANKLYVKNNPEKRKASTRAWRQNNKPYLASVSRGRNAAKLLRTPKWVGPDEMWLMKEAYELAALRTKMFGFAWHVDHIIPLCGKIVSGLHVPTNLRVIPAVENMSKLNKFEVAL